VHLLNVFIFLDNIVFNNSFYYIVHVKFYDQILTMYLILEVHEKRYFQLFELYFQKDPCNRKVYDNIILSI